MSSTPVKKTSTKKTVAKKEAAPKKFAVKKSAAPAVPAAPVEKFVDDEVSVEVETPESEVVETTEVVESPVEDVLPEGVAELRTKIKRTAEELANDKKKLRKLEKPLRVALAPKKVCTIHKTLAKFLQVPHDQKLSRSEIKTHFSKRLRTLEGSFVKFDIFPENHPELLSLLGPAVHPKTKTDPELGYNYHNLTKYLAKYIQEE